MDRRNTTGETSTSSSCDHIKRGRTAVFWLFSLGAFTTSGLGTGVLFHHFSILASGGISRADATTIFLPYGVAAVIFGLLGGLLVDRVAHRFILATGQILMAGILCSAVHLSTLPTLWAYGIALGPCRG